MLPRWPYSPSFIYSTWHRLVRNYIFLFPFQLCHWDRGSLRGWFSWSLSIQRRLFRDGRRCRICGGPPWPFTIHWPHEGTFCFSSLSKILITQNPMHHWWAHQIKTTNLRILFSPIFFSWKKKAPVGWKKNYVKHWWKGHIKKIRRFVAWPDEIIIS